MPAATPTDSPGLPSVPAAGAITDSRRGPDLAQPLRLRANPHHPPNPGQPAAGVRQIGRPGARPGPGLGAIGPHGRQQLGQRIGRGGHRRGRGGGAAAGFPQADRGGRGGQLEQALGPAAGTAAHPSEIRQGPGRSLQGRAPSNWRRNSWSRGPQSPVRAVALPPAGAQLTSQPACGLIPAAMCVRC